jgi:alpha-glucosidase (family GH31 glycosyl hydrolase)
LQYIGQHVIDNIILEVYPGGDGQCTLYTDDGKSIQYKQGDYAMTTITQHEGKLHISAPQGKYQSPVKTYTVRIHTDTIARSIYNIDAGKENTIDIK